MQRVYEAQYRTGNGQVVTARIVYPDGEVFTPVGRLLRALNMIAPDGGRLEHHRDYAVEDGREVETE